MLAAISASMVAAARIQLDFVDPSGSKNGKLLLTGNEVDEYDGVKATCIDVGTPPVVLSKPHH